MSNTGDDLSLSKKFEDRHCGLSPKEQAEMLAFLGLNDIEDMGRLMPSDIYSEISGLPDPLSEEKALSAIYGFARKNKVLTSMIGLGYYGTVTPPVVRRSLLESPAWYTAYTPYQAEIAQGRLEMLLNFQTMISDLTGLPMAGASLLDEATAAAEAMALLYRESKTDNRLFLADSGLFPQTLAVLQTRAEPLGIEILVTTPDDFANHANTAYGALFAYPASDGQVLDLTDLITNLKNQAIGVAVAVDLLALCLLKTPGDMGADIAIGSAQRFGLPMGGGGPHPGFIAFREQYRMRVPGRIVGVSKDKQGRVGYRLALQSREQHIRREKATSNICTAQALPAMLAVGYAIYNGSQQILHSAKHVQKMTERLASGLKQQGRKITGNCFFGTIRVLCDDADAVVQRAADAGINLYRAENGVGISIDETITAKDIKTVWNAFGENSLVFSEVQGEEAIPQNLLRQTPFLSHPIFNTYHTEQEMLRYLQRLSTKDISLNRSMIPLGSCTMKLNASIEMEPISWPQFSNMHPFAPENQNKGYKDLCDDLSDLLAKITGFDAVCLQPNAGAQGEYAGLLTIRAYLRDKGEMNRNVCLIPRSAHGTNPASAVLAGMKVVVLEVDNVGQVDIEDLRKKVEIHQTNLAALMLTYPSTCGVFGNGLREICSIVHTAGGQVYMDGANLNALVGICSPGQCGPDVMHINLHKTFCIPHGGGGPGMGPIGVGAHLKPYLPGHPLDSTSPTKYCGTISAAPLGSPLILIISWMYIRLMGGAGLKRATLTALLSANYILKRLEKKLPPCYVNSDGYVAHECIVDPRGYKKSAGVSVEDIAKRLIDFGFHAPTVSWPVAGTMMIEPTESESKAEIDRFCDSMLQIIDEIENIESGKWSKEDNPLVNSPHVGEDLLVDNWTHAYTREEAAFPLDWVRQDKYWPPIGRIDSAYGDRNLVCSCPPLEDFEDDS